MENSVSDISSIRGVNQFRYYTYCSPLIYEERNKVQGTYCTRKVRISTPGCMFQPPPNQWRRSSYVSSFYACLKLGVTAIALSLVARRKVTRSSTWILTM